MRGFSILYALWATVSLATPAGRSLKELSQKEIVYPVGVDGPETSKAALQIALALDS